ncbi:MAG: hypothetical protein AAF430_13275 [Myxococcota bacterium]
MQLPHSDPIGLPVVPKGYRRTPRAYPRRVRIGAGVLLGIFVTVVVVTTAVSLGTYCLTTDTANAGDLPRNVFAPGPGSTGPAPAAP